MKIFALTSIFLLSSFFCFSNESDTVIVNFDVRDSIVTYATEFIGTPYKWGGESTSGFDCSGFVLYVFKKFGYRLPHSSAAMGNLGTVKRKNAQNPATSYFSKEHKAHQSVMSVLFMKMPEN